MTAHAGYTLDQAVSAVYAQQPQGQGYRRIVQGEEPPERAGWCSPSQLEVFCSCERKWGWRYIAKIKKPPHPSAAKGKVLHAIAEQYLKTGYIDLSGMTYTTDDIDQYTARYLADLVLAAMPLLPPPMLAGMALERHMAVMVGDAKVHGYLDCYIPGNTPRIIDHKSTSRPDKALTTATLPRDVQFITYALAAMADTHTERADGRWIYYPTRGAKKPWAVDASVTRKDCEPTAKLISDTGALIQLRRKTTIDVLTLDYNPNRCGDYGGCPYIQNCNLTPKEQLRGYNMSNNQLDDAAAFTANLQARLNGGGQPPAADGAPPWGTPQAPQAPQASQALPPWQPAAIAPAAPQAPQQPQQAPWAPANPQPAGNVPAQTGITYETAGGAPWQPNPAPTQLSTPQFGPPQPPAQPQAQHWAPPPVPNGGNDAPKQTRHRRTKAELAEVGGFTACIDCAPINGEGCEDFAQRVPRIMGRINTMGLQHYSQHPNGVVMWQQLVAEDLTTNPPAKHLICFTAQREVAEALPAIQARAKGAFRGFK